MTAINDIIKNEEKKCNNEILEKVIQLIGEGKSFQEIMTEARLSLFELSRYLEVSFYKTNYDPAMYVEKDKVQNIMKELNSLSFPSLKEVKNKYPDYEYTEIRIVRGVYFRTPHYYQRKSTKKTKDEEQLTLFGDGSFASSPQKEKVDLTTVPFLLEIIDTLETEHWKQFALELFAKYTPKQFYIMPASMSKNVHNETELDVGKFDEKDPKKLVKMGGKYYHSYRVYQQLLDILEPDSPEIWNWSRDKVVKYVYGNEYEPWERDAMKVAALSHDIFSGGTEDEFNPNRRRMDKNHAHYHKTELLPLKDLVPEEEWNAYILMVDNHMWKWDPLEPTIKFHEGRNKETVEECCEHYRLYRLVKNVELSDYLASRRNDALIPRFKQAIETWFYCKGNLDITWDDLNQMGLNEKDIRKAFGKPYEPLGDILKLLLGDRYSQMVNQTMLS